MYYHASSIGTIQQLEPRISNHGIPLIYFSKKRENVLVYLSNAVEKYCRETGFAYEGRWQKWGPYGFDKNGLLRLEEYYPDALVKTYKGVSGYIYAVHHIEEAEFDVRIPYAATRAAFRSPSIPWSSCRTPMKPSCRRRRRGSSRSCAMNRCPSACGNGTAEPYGRNTNPARITRSTGTS